MTLECDFTSGQYPQVNYQQTEDLILLDLIYATNNVDKEVVSYDNFFFKKTSIRTPTEDKLRNTRIELVAKPTVQYYGLREFFYNRVFIEEFTFNGLVTKEHLTFKITDEQTSHDIIPQVNYAIGVQLTEEMVTKHPLPIHKLKEGRLTPYFFYPRHDNLVFLGQLKVWLTL